MNLYDSLLEDSELTPEYREMIVATLTRIPETVLVEIQGRFDRVFVLGSKTYGGAEIVGFMCKAKHETRPSPIVFRRKGEPPPSKPPEDIIPVYHKKWIIMLVDDNLRKLSKAQRHSVIAEEFAHVYLKHDKIPEGELGDYNEREADALIREWGFKPVCPVE
jgi:hypothetical protein